MTSSAFTYFSKDLVLGNIDKMSLKQAWNSDKMNELRKQLESGKNMSAGCARCLNGVYMIKMKD
ncbi:MAG: SPASM domain-containing protein [Candidatus Woesearchaeota archaeon]|nr:SPASM domain-containing protein [Candidatus Woesearchaeota archaeon]